MFDANVSLINWETENFFDDLVETLPEGGGALSRSGWGYEDDDGEDEVIVEVPGD